MEAKARNETTARSRWTRNGADWSYGRLGWCVGLSAAEAAELIGVDRSAFYARMRAEGWVRELNDDDMMALMRSVALAAAIRDMIEGRADAVLTRAKQVEAITRIARTPAEPKRKPRKNADAPRADVAADKEAPDETAGGAHAARHDRGEHDTGGYDQRIRRAILERLDRLGIHVAEADTGANTGAEAPADAGNQRENAAFETGPPARAGPVA